MYKKFLSIIFIFFTISLTSCVTDGGEDINEVINYINVGDKLPAFGYNEFNTNDFTGKRSLLVLFETTCPDCKRVLPKVEQVWQQLKENTDYKVVAVARGQKISVTEGSWGDNYTMPVISDEGKNIFNFFANRMIPRVYIINPEGIVTHMWIEKLDITATEVIELMNE